MLALDIGAARLVFELRVGLCPFAALRVLVEMVHDAFLVSHGLRFASCSFIRLRAVASIRARALPNALELGGGATSGRGMKFTRLPPCKPQSGSFGPRVPFP